MRVRNAVKHAVETQSHMHTLAVLLRRLASDDVTDDSGSGSGGAVVVRMRGAAGDQVDRCRAAVLVAVCGVS